MHRRAPRRLPALKRSALAVALAFLPAAGSVLAADCTLTTNGDWATAGNWSCAVRPGTPNTLDTATINIGGIVSISLGEQIRTLTNAGTINIDAFGLNLIGGGGTINTGTINVGGASTANLGVSAGHNITNTGGVINIADGSVVNQFGSTITGGTITTTGSGALVAFNNNSNFLAGVTLNGTLDMAGGTGIQRITGGLVLNGTINLNANSILSFSGDQTLGGNGTVVLGSTGSSNRALSMEGNTVLTIGSAMVVRGENGTLGQAHLVGGNQSLVNNGRISADVLGGTISLAPSNGTTNNGVLEAKNGGTLVLNSNVIGNVGSSIAAGAGSTVLQNGVALSGVINTTGTGIFRAANSNSNFLNGVTLNGNLDMASATGIQRVTGGLVLNGIISINANSVLSFSGDQTLGGNGTVVLGNTGSSNRALSMEGNTVLTIGSGVVVRGENGTLGQAYLNGGNQSLINNGRISADVAGGSISLEPSNGTTNNGVLEAQNGGRLVLNSSVIGNVGSSIVAGAGSTVLQNGVALSGVINTTGSGTFRAANSNSNFLNGVTLNGNLDLASATGIERVTGGLVLNGTISINANSILSFSGDQTLGGNGTVVLGSTGSSNRALSMDGNTVLTIGSGVVVRGENGTVGRAYLVGGNQLLINNGRISADVSGGSISLEPSNGTTNNGVLEAQNGGTLVLNSNVIGASGGSIVAGAGSTVVQNGVRLSGVINSSGTGNFRVANSNSNFLDGVTFNGPLDMATATSIERVVNGLTLNGSIAVNANSVLSFSGTQTLDGNGTIVLGSTGSSNRALSLEGNAVLTVGSGITVRGENGTVGQAYLTGGVQQITNNGSIVADVGGGTIALAATLTQNNALLGAANGGTLRLDGAVTQAGAGQINAATGSTVLQSGVTITGGVLNTAGTGRVAVSNSNSNFLSGVTLGGLLDMATATGIERVLGGLTLGSGGTISVNSNSLLSFSGDQTLGGNGTVLLGSTGSSNRALSLEGNTTLTVAAGVTVRGVNGTLGQAHLVGGNQVIANSGTINSDGGGLITVTPTSLVNDGLVRAQNGALTIQSALSGAGTLQVDAAGTMNLPAGAKSQGTLAMGATGATLNVGTGSLTLSSDYTNLGAGTGNSFNRRAGIVGTGAIDAAPGVVQTVTGNTVSNGTSATPTLAITNVRVGAPTTFDFQVGNSGTGPALRGAVQTTVNGGNLTDGQLGFTATNFGPGSTQTVSFNATGAGLITIAPNQKLAIVNNFDNTQSQNQLLNIVAGPGAAAYNAAQGSVGTAPVTVNVANQRILGSASTALTVSNVAPTGAFTEVLNASFGTATGNATNNIASITGGLGAGGVAAGSSDSSTMRVGVNTAAEGLRTGTQVVNFQSNGTGTSGLGTIGVGSQTVSVQGNVYKVASGQLDTAALNFGVIQVGQSVSPVNLAFTNSATGQAGFVEDLKVTFGSITGSNSGFVSTNGGQMTGILAGQSSTGANGTMTVSVNTANAGVVNAQVGLNYITQGTVGGVSNGLGEAGVGSGSFGVTGTINALIVNQAAAQINNPAITIAARVGDSLASTQRAVSVTNVAGAPPQAGLNAVLSTTNNPPVTATGSFNLLGAGATNNTSLVVGLASTAAAQSFSNAATTVAFVSDATNQGCLVNCTVDQGSQIVTVNGKVYTPAIASVAPSVNFGIVRVGDVVANRGVSVANSAAVTALNDTLTATIGGTGGAFTNNAGTVNGLIAGAAANNTALTVGLNTAAAGVFNGTASVASTSRNPDMADLSLGSSTVTLTGQVNNLAVAAFQKTSGAGTFTQTAVNAFTLDFGDIAQGASGILTARLAAWNRAMAGEPSDDLKGEYTGAVDSAALSFSGFSAFGPGGTALGTGQTGPELLVNLFNTSSIGLFTQTITLAGLSFNADDPLGIGTSATLFVRANVFDPGNTSVIPLPPAGFLLLGGLAMMGWLGRRRRA